LWSCQNLHIEPPAGRCTHLCPPCSDMTHRASSPPLPPTKHTPSFATQLACSMLHAICQGPAQPFPTTALSTKFSFSTDQTAPTLTRYSRNLSELAMQEPVADQQLTKATLVAGGARSATHRLKIGISTRSPYKVTDYVYLSEFGRPGRSRESLTPRARALPRSAVALPNNWGCAPRGRCGLGNTPWALPRAPAPATRSVFFSSKLRVFPVSLRRKQSYYKLCKSKSHAKLHTKTGTKHDITQL
jgi:hypothetical protein